MRSALLLTLGATGLLVFYRSWFLVSSVSGFMASWRGLLLETAIAALCLGGGAYLGLCVLDGDHRRLLPMKNLSRAQLLWLALLGAAAVFPVALTADLALFYAYKMPVLAAPEPANAARLIKSVLIVPVLEEVFYRGYLLGALRPRGVWRATAVVCVCFALAHTTAFAAHALLSVLLCVVTVKSGSILAPIVVHAGYNLTLFVLSGLGLSGLVMGWSLLACCVKVLGCAAFAAVLRRAYGAHPAGGRLAWPAGERLARREGLLVLAAGALLAVSLVMGG